MAIITGFEESENQGIWQICKGVCVVKDVLALPACECQGPFQVPDRVWGGLRAGAQGRG